MSSSLVIILFHDNAWPHVARMTLLKLTDLGYETFPHPFYFHLLTTIYQFIINGVMVIVVGNEHGDTSSNPGQD